MCVLDFRPDAGSSQRSPAENPLEQVSECEW